MLTLYLYFLITTCVLAYLQNDRPLNPYDLSTDTFKPRIVGGTIPLFHAYRYVAYITFGKNHFPCTGSIIAEKYVITAEHCLAYAAAHYGMHKAKKYLTVKVGSQSKRFGQTFKVVNTFATSIEPYTANPADFLILELNREINLYDDHTVEKIRLKRWEPRFNERFTVVGHGDHIVGGRVYERTSYVVNNITVKSASSFCKPKSYEFCGFGQNQGVTPGDSGGPVITTVENTEYQIGVILEGLPRTGANKFTFGKYLNIRPFCDFIEESTKGAAICE